ncbi:MAG: ATP-binding protein [Gaiellaceae bacterium]|jgi:serine/threonine-protein kinase RsbW
MAADQGMSSTTNGNGATVHLTIPARAEYITLCRLALTGIARVRDLPDEVLADLKLALTEAASNSVRHAYAGEEQPGVVQISYELRPDRLVIEVTDEGEGFDPQESEGPPEELSEGGLGIAIIRAIADEVEIGTQPSGKGSRLRFEKELG